MVLHVAEASSMLQILSQELSSLSSPYMQATHVRSQGAIHPANGDPNSYSLMTTGKCACVRQTLRVVGTIIMLYKGSENTVS
jgi:hypothetical protein